MALLVKFKKKKLEFDVYNEKETNSAAAPSTIYLANKPNLFYMFELDFISQSNTNTKGLTFVLIISSMLLTIKSYRMLAKENKANIMQSTQETQQETQQTKQQFILECIHVKPTRTPTQLNTIKSGNSDNCYKDSDKDQAINTIDSSQAETQQTNKAHNIGKIVKNVCNEIVLQNKRVVSDCLCLFVCLD